MDSTDFATAKLGRGLLGGMPRPLPPTPRYPPLDHCPNRSLSLEDIKCKSEVGLTPFLSGTVYRYLADGVTDRRETLHDGRAVFRTLTYLHRNVQHRCAHAHRIALRMRVKHSRTQLLQFITGVSEQPCPTELPASSNGKSLACWVLHVWFNFTVGPFLKICSFSVGFL